MGSASAGMQGELSALESAVTLLEERQGEMEAANSGLKEELCVAEAAKLELEA